MDRGTARLNRRETLALGSSCVAGLTVHAGWSAPAGAAEPLIFPEPKVNRLMRGIEGLSRRMGLLRTVLINNLDDYRAWETKARGGDPKSIPGVADGDWELRCRLRENICSMGIIAELTGSRREPDRLFREIANSLGNDPEFFQVPPDDSDQMLSEIDGVAELEWEIEQRGLT